MSREDGQLVVGSGRLSRAAPGHREPDPELVTVAAVVGADELDDPAVLELPARLTRAERSSGTWVVSMAIGSPSARRSQADATDAGRRAEIPLAQRHPDLGIERDRALS